MPQQAFISITQIQTLGRHRASLVLDPVQYVARSLSTALSVSGLTPWGLNEMPHLEVASPREVGRSRHGLAIGGASPAGQEGGATQIETFDRTA